MTKYVLIECDDWAGFFKDGKLLQEGHSIPTRDLCNELGISYTFDEDEIDEYLIGNRGFPNDINDLPGIDAGNLPR